jgi:flavin reductase (DIM6/NTAB) family NADH-FMN oxidoreductase RutF
MSTGPAAAAAREFDTIEPAAASGPERYRLFMGSVIPRPIALVCSLNDRGGTNVAPFSNFMVVSASAALVAFSIGSEAGAGDREKDTLHNVRQRKEFVINTVPAGLARQVQDCSKTYPPEVSEAEENGLTLIASSAIATPRIAETKIQFECRLHSIVPFDGPHLIVGRVVLVHAEHGLVQDYKIDPTRYSPLGRIGGRTYCTLGELIHV